MAVNEHITDEIFNRYAARKASAAETLNVQTHSAVCENCREKLARIVQPRKAFAAIHNSFLFDDLAQEPEHLPFEQLEFFVDKKLDEVDREIAESHLSFCEECKQDLADLQVYRNIAAAPSVVITAEDKKSFWQRLLAFDSIAGFAPVAAVLLLAILFGAWFLMRGGKEEIARETNQNTAPANLNPMSNIVAPTVAPDASPSPIENVPNTETLYALKDGQITIDEKGDVKGLENLSAATQNLIRQSLQTENVAVTANTLGGGSGVLMSESDAAGGVPFALVSPIGKIIRENQPVLRWKPLKDATAYSVAIVDDKFRVVETSVKLTSTNWKPSKPLQRGANYSWQVTATLADGTETVSPSSPAPQARFRVIEQNLLDDIKKLEKSAAPSSFALGVLYAKAGLKQEARAQFEKLVRQNPNSKLARKLLQSVK